LTIIDAFARVGRIDIHQYLSLEEALMGEDTVRKQVRQRYASAALAVTAPGDQRASCCGPATTEIDERFGAGLYGDDVEGLPAEAVAASLGCGNPLAVADLAPGERVLDLGSGGGIDVLLSARRVGPTGKAYGLDMTDEMLALARANATKAGTSNVEFLKGQIEAIPLPADSIDVVISNCVINLSTDKPAVLAEMFRVLAPGGRIGISDMVAEDHLSPADRAERGSNVECIAGALSRTEYLDGLAAAGFADPSVTFTHDAAPGLHGAIIRATKPTDGAPSSTATTATVGPADENASGCCGPAVQQSCCEPAAKSECCGDQQAAGQCGCQ
jgi:arsenite methyltransferase